MNNMAVKIDGHYYELTISHDSTLGCFMAYLKPNQRLINEVQFLKPVMAMGGSATEAIESFACDCEHFGLSLKMT